MKTLTPRQAANLRAIEAYKAGHGRTYTQADIDAAVAADRAKQPICACGDHFDAESMCATCASLDESNAVAQAVHDRVGQAVAEERERCAKDRTRLLWFVGRLANALNRAQAPRLHVNPFEWRKDRDELLRAVAVVAGGGDPPAPPQEADHA